MFLEIILSIVFLLLLGFISKEVDILNSKRVSILNMIAFNILVPAMVFQSTSESSLSEIYSPTLLLGFYLVFFSTLFISFLLYMRSKNNAKRSVSMIQSCMGNLGYMGLPILSATFGQKAVAQASMLLGLAVIIQLPLMMGLLIYFNSATRSNSSLRKELQDMFLNPIIFALVLGTLASHFGVMYPEVVGTLLSYMGTIALIIAMLGVGASLELTKTEQEVEYFFPVVMLKLLFMPALGWAVFSWLGAPSLTLQTGVLLLGMPTAVITFVYTEELGGNEQLASFNITSTTLFSLLSISALLFFL